MAKKSKENNHFVSEFYLQYWANSDNKVWVYRKKNPFPNTRRPFVNPEQLHTGKICSEEKLYWIGENTIIEDWSAQNIETICGKVFKKVINKKSLTEDDIDSLKVFLAFHISRSPVHKEGSKKLLNEFRPDTVPVNPLAQTLRARMRIRLQYMVSLHTQILSIPDSCDQTFITSDTPFFILPESPANILENTHYWFPLSPQKAVFFAPSKLTPLYQDLDCDQVQQVNKMFALMEPNILIAKDPKAFDKNVVKIFEHVSKGDKK